MRTFPDVRMGDLHGLAARGNDACRAEDFGAALTHYQDLLRRLGAVGLKSAWVHWAIAVTHDNLEERELALSSIRKALAMDPLNPNAQRSFEIIARRVRDHLHALPVADPSVPRLYGLLQQSGDVDVATHLLVVRHYAAIARIERAEELLEALSLTAPASGDVWRERSALALERGDVETAAKFEEEADSRSHSDAPFAIPSQGLTS